MRAWLPGGRLDGPVAATEADIEALNRVFAEAFTDRDRRDGLVGVRVPYLNPQVWRYALLDAGAGAMLWRDESGRVAGFNIAHRSGREGWMGPLAVRPDRQAAGAGKTVVQTAVDWLVEQGVTTLGLETMPRTVDNIGFYSRLGFTPGRLTVTMTNDIATRGHRAPTLLSQRPPAERAATLAARDERACTAGVAAAEAAAARAGIRRVSFRCQTTYEDAYRRLIERGYRVRWTDLRMTLEGYAERAPAHGVLLSNWEIGPPGWSSSGC